MTLKHLNTRKHTAAGSPARRSPSSEDSMRSASLGSYTMSSQNLRVFCRPACRRQGMTIHYETMLSKVVQQAGCCRQSRRWHIKAGRV